MRLGSLRPASAWLCISSQGDSAFARVFAMPQIGIGYCLGWINEDM